MQEAIFIAAAPGTTWPLGVHDLVPHLEARFPGVRHRHKHAPVSRTHHLDFETALDGMTRHGTYVDHSHLILRDGDPASWADTIAWFLTLLPAHAPAVAVVESNPDILDLPVGAGAQEITVLLTALLDAE